MMEPLKVLDNESEVVEWINAYEEGYEIPDEVMTKILYAAQLYAALMETDK